jgi:acyl carrier protein
MSNGRVRDKSVSEQRHLHAELSTLVADELGIPADRIDVDRDLAAAYGVDSLDLIAFAITVQERYGVILRDPDLERARTIRDLATLVTAQRA